MIEEINPDIADLARWLDRKCRHHAYGSFGITATVHDGRITRIERYAMESLKPENSIAETTRGRRRPKVDARVPGGRT